MLHIVTPIFTKTFHDDCMLFPPLYLMGDWRYTYLLEQYWERHDWLVAMLHLFEFVRLNYIYIDLIPHSAEWVFNMILLMVNNMLTWLQLLKSGNIRYEKMAECHLCVHNMIIAWTCNDAQRMHRKHHRMTFRKWWLVL